MMPLWKKKNQNQTKQTEKFIPLIKAVIICIRDDNTKGQTDIPKLLLAKLVALLSAVPEKILTSESEPLSEEELQCHSAALAPVMLQYQHHCCSDAAVP